MAGRKGSQARTEGETGTDDRDAELAELRRQLADANGRATTTESLLAAERQARVKAEEATMSEAERRVRAELQTVESTLGSLNTEADGVEAEIARLSDEPGHGAEIAKLTRRLSQIEAKTTDLTNRKSFWEAEAEKAKTATTARRAAPATGAEELANGTKLSEMDPKAAEWARKHPRMMTDPAYMKRVFAAANYAESFEGLAQNSPEYFRYIEERMGERTDDGQTGDEGEDIVTEQRRETQDRTAGRATASSPLSRTQEQDEGADLDYRVKTPQTPAAGRGSLAAVPATRTVPGSGTGRGGRREPLLSADEREVADALYGHEKDPAKRYMKYADNRELMKQRDRGGFANN